MTTTLPPLGPHSRVSTSPEALSVDVNGEFVLMSLKDGQYAGLDGIGSIIWARLAHPVTVGELCTELATRYRAAPGRIEQDVLDFLGQLQARDMIRVCAD